MHKTYNQIALDVMKKHKVKINDLHSFVLPRMSELQRPNNVHFSEYGSKELAKVVVKSILENSIRVHMEILKIHAIILLLTFSIKAHGQNTDKKTENNLVKFPSITGPFQLTDQAYEHFFASYYGINSFSANEQYATVLRTK